MSPPGVSIPAGHQSPRMLINMSVPRLLPIQLNVLGGTQTSVLFKALECFEKLWSVQSVANTALQFSDDLPSHPLTSEVPNVPTITISSTKGQLLMRFGVLILFLQEKSINCPTPYKSQLLASKKPEVGGVGRGSGSTQYHQARWFGPHFCASVSLLQTRAIISFLPKDGARTTFRM